MAWIITSRGANEGSFVADLVAGDTFTPVENDIIIVAASVSSSFPFNGVIGWGATWEQLVLVGTNSGRLHVWACRIGANPASDFALIDFNSTRTGSAITIQISGASTAGTVLDVFVQNQTVAVYNPSTPLSIPTLSPFQSPTNLSLSFGAIQNNNNFTPQAGWTQANQASIATTDLNVAGFYLDVEDTTQTVEGTGFFFRYVAGAGFELAEESVAGQDISPPSISSTLNFGNATINNENNLDVLPIGISSTLNFGNANISIDSALDVLPSSISSTLSFGNANISINDLGILPNSITSTLSFGTQSIVVDSDLDILPVSITSTLNFGNALIENDIELNISPSSISSTLSFGTTSILKENNLEIITNSINSTLSFGSAVISNGSLINISPNSILSTLSFGSTIINNENDLEILPNGITSSLIFGTAIISSDVLEILPTSINSTLSFGNATVSDTNIVIQPTSINSTLNFGTNVLTIESDLDILPNGITSTLNFGTSVLTIDSDLDILSLSISSTLSFGNTNISSNDLDILPSSINSTLNFGNALVVSFKIIDILPNSITSTLSFGDLQIFNESVIFIIVQAPKERTFYIELENRTFNIELEDRTFNIELEDRTFIVKAGDKKVKEINKGPQATLNYSFNINKWIEAGDSFSSYSITVSSGLTLGSDGELDNIITGVVSGGADQGTESIVCTFNTTNGLSDQRTILLNMGNR